MMVLLIIWCLLTAALVIFAIGRSRREGALTLSYFLSLSLIHVPGVLAFIDATYASDVDADTEMTRLGFVVTLVGMAAFVVGAVIARGISPSSARIDGQLKQKIIREYQHTSVQFILVGTAAYVFLIPISTYVPSLTSLVAPLAILLVIGLWLRFYGSLESDRPGGVVGSLLVLPLLPLTSLVSAGFIGHGVSWALSVVTFFFIFARRRIYFYLATPLVVFLGLSLFVTYMGQRGEIRRVMWYSQGSTLQNIEQISTVVTKFHFLDLNSVSDRTALDSRLNQNYLVGLGVSRHQDGLNDLYYGATVPWWAFIPRVIWPDKPNIGGGGSLVALFTHKIFDRNTSVGVGQVLEFYMNFSYVGVVLGFAAFGFILMRIDRAMMRALTGGDLRKLLIYALAGLTLLQPGGNLLEIVVGLVSALVTAHMLNHLQIFVPPSREQQKSLRDAAKRAHQAQALPLPHK